MNWHTLDLNTDDEVESNINFTVNIPEDTGNRNLVIINAPLET